MQQPGSSPPPATSQWWLTLHGHLYRYTQLLKRRWWVVFLTVSIGMGVAAVVTLNLPPKFMSQARMMVSGRVNMPESNSVYTEELFNFFGTQMELMQSGQVRNSAFAKVQALFPETPVDVKAELTVGQQPKASIFVLRVVSQDPKFAQQYLDACMEAYIGTKRQMRTETSESTITSMADELVNVEKELRAAEDKLIDFQRTNNVGYLEKEGNSAALYLSGLNRQIADLRTEYTLLEKLNLDQILEGPAQQAVPDPRGPSQNESILRNLMGPAEDYMKSRQQLQLLRAERDQFAKVMRPKHPEMFRLNEEVARLENLIEIFRRDATEQVQSRRETLRLRLENLEPIALEWELKAADFSRRLAEYERARGQVERIKVQYDRLSTSLSSMGVSKSVQQDAITILEKASPPLSVRPLLPKTLALGLLGGFLVGAGILVLLDRIDDRVTSVHDAQRHFPEHLIGQVMHEEYSGNLGLLHEGDARHGFAESFRNIRSSLLYMPFAGERPKAFLITSAVPNEGKSTVAENLAVAFAMSGAKTLLVDGDLRRGAIHRVFGVPNEAGLSEVLAGGIQWAEATIQTAVENLTLLPRGRLMTQGSERLLGPTTDKFLREVYAAYDYIIFDSAPVLVADDTASLAPKIDAVICMFRFAHSSVRMTRRVLDLLKQRQANVIGLVLNDVKAHTPEYGYYQYKDYYKAATVD